MPATSPPQAPAWLAACADKSHLAFATRAWATLSNVEGFLFDDAAAEKAVASWPIYFRHTEGRWAGKSFRLTDWQEAIVRLIVGAKGADGFRLIRRLILWVARKNGKTEFLASLGLFFWLADGEQGGQGFAFARDEKQARIVFDKMRRMIALSDALSTAVTGRYARQLWCSQLWSKFELLSGNAEGKHGLSASVIVGDEIHEWQSEVLYTTLHQSTAARDQPIELLASTAGLRGKGYGEAVWDESRAIEAGHVSDPSTLVVIFALDPADDWLDEANWHKANPNMGISPKVEYLRAEAQKARLNPRLKANFQRYHLNLWVDSLNDWLPPDIWRACAPDPLRWRAIAAGEGLGGRTCYGGVDLSATRDITALLWLFAPAEDDPLRRWTVKPEFWLPESVVEERAERDRANPWRQWVEHGLITATPGNAVDQNYTMRAIEQGLETWDVAAMGFDAWQAQKLIGDLQGVGLEPERIVKLRQGTQSLGEPSKEFERLVYAGRLDHGQHPVLTWMAGHCSIRFDSNMNFVPAKRASRDKIDGVVAAIMALALSMLPDEREPGLADYVASLVGEPA